MSEMMTFEEWRVTVPYWKTTTLRDAWDKSGGVHTAAQREPMPCTHPRACVVSANEGTNHCGWCASLDAEREACAVLCDELAAEYNEASRSYSDAITRARWDTVERTALILAEEIRRRGKEAGDE